MTASKLLVYFIRRDIRASDNPILNHLSTSPDHGFTHLLPIFVLPPHQLEVSGFLAEGQTSPYPKALSKVGKFWRCGPHRAKFLAQSVWDLKIALEGMDSGLVLRVGSFADVLRHIVDSLREKQQSIGAVWMSEEKSDEEVREQDDISSICAEHEINFRLWVDEKYFIDERDTGLKSPQDLPDVFTTFRKEHEPLRQKPRSSLPSPSSLPSLPSCIPPQQGPFKAPEGFPDFEERLLRPLKNIVANPPVYPRDAESAHPFRGGESNAWIRIRHLINSGAMSNYKDTRNGLVGLDFSTKLSAYLSLGCITSRQIHEELVKLEDGTDSAYQHAPGYGGGENTGTQAVRFELLWRDYMRLCTMKFGAKLFRVSGFRQYEEGRKKEWKTADENAAKPDQDPSPEAIKEILTRFLEGRTGMGLIDASQRELFHTGYTSNRARQNVASFFSKHLGIDWRYGAEWYEAMLIDYDVSSNWSNWQYVAGVGNDPRGDARIFNPVKQAFDYDNNGRYVRMWVPEVKYLEKLENVFQVWTTSESELEQHGLSDDLMVTDPVKKIQFLVDRKPRGPRRPYRWRGRGRGRRADNGGGRDPGESPSRSVEGADNAGGQSGGGNPTADERAQRSQSQGGQSQQQHRQQQEQHQHQRPQHRPPHYYQQSQHQHLRQQATPHEQPRMRGGVSNRGAFQDSGFTDFVPQYNVYPTQSYPGSGVRGAWGPRGRGSGWRGSGRGGSGRGNMTGFRRGYGPAYFPQAHHGYVPASVYPVHPNQLGPV